MNAYVKSWYKDGVQMTQRLLEKKEEEAVGEISV